MDASWLAGWLADPRWRSTLAMKNWRGRKEGRKEEVAKLVWSNAEMKNRPVERRIEQRDRERGYDGGEYACRNPSVTFSQRDFEERERERERGLSLRDSVEAAETSSACLECNRGSRQSHWSSTGTSSPGASAASVERQPTSLIDWHVYYCDGERKGEGEKGPACIYIFSILNDWSPAYYH